MRQSAGKCEFVCARVCACRYVEGERLKSRHTADGVGWRETEGLEDEDESKSGMLYK